MLVRNRIAGSLVALERAWLAPTAEPLARRAAAAGWAPDEPGAYCDRCGMTVGAYEQDEFGCAACRDSRPAWDRFVRLGEFDGPLRDWVHEVKFTRFRALGLGLGRLLGGAMAGAGLPRERVLIVPAPMAWRRRLWRGIDHARVIAQGAAEAAGAPLAPALAARRRPPQHTLTRTERLSNLRGGVRALEGLRLEGWTIAVVDDVRTTGQTLHRCARALRRAHPGAASVWACALAVTPGPGRRRQPEVADAPRLEM